jgi:hypothetical protein
MVHIKVKILDDHNTDKIIHGSPRTVLRILTHLMGNKKAGREGGTPGNLRRVTGTITDDETPEYQ